MIRAWAALSLFFFAAVTHAQTCESIFELHAKVADARANYDLKMSHVGRLKAAQETDVQIVTEFLKERDLEGWFLPGKKLLILRDDKSNLEQFFYFHHEVVHSTTTHRLRTNPAAEENILALTIRREGASIDSRLPLAYREKFQADEMKAYRRGSVLARQILKEIPSLDTEEHDAFDFREKSNLGASNTFALVSYELLKQAEKLLAEPAHLHHLALKIEPYDEGFEKLFEVTLEVPQKKGPPTTLHFPLYDPSANGNQIHDLRPKLLRLARLGQTYSLRYMSDLKP